MFGARFWRNFDWILLGITLLLAGLGILILYAITFKGGNLGAAHDVRNQSIFVVIGLAALVVFARVDYRSWRQLTSWLYVIMLGLLGFVSLAGKSAQGATRWINVGFFQFQPSELAKLVLVIILAKYFSDHYEEMDQPRYLLTSALYMLVPVLLVLVQPDLGTAMVLVVIWLVMAVVARARMWQLAGLAVVATALFPLVIKILKPYQKARLHTFLNPAADPLSSGYNVVQSTIAVGSGQLYGRGLAAGSQSQLNFLPSQHTDFIFAVLAEKLGFAGAILLLLLFTALIGRGLLVAYRARDRFGLLLAVGIITMMLFHLFINVGMNMGIAPVTGIPLPFISYGGTSLLIAMISVGLLESISIRHRTIQFGT